MIHTENMTDQEIMEAGLELLARELGPAGHVRFLQQLAPGRGNYTEERHQWLDGLTLDDIIRDIERRRAERATDEEPSED